MKCRLCTCRYWLDSFGDGDDSCAPPKFLDAIVPRLPNDSMFCIRLAELTYMAEPSCDDAWCKAPDFLTTSLAIICTPYRFWYCGTNLWSSLWSVSFLLDMLLPLFLSTSELGSLISTLSRLAVAPRYSFGGETLLLVFASKCAEPMRGVSVGFRVESGASLGSMAYDRCVV